MLSLIIILLNTILIEKCLSQSLTTTVHKTQAAAEKVNDLWCYTCHTMDDGDVCYDIAVNKTNHTKKCNHDEFICMIQRFSYTTSTENSTSSPKMWSLERRCTTVCEPGCIIIGERTKLYACISCCETPLCNIGKGSSNQLNLISILLILSLLLTVECQYCN